MREYAIDRAFSERAGVADYFMVAKPGIVALVLVSTLTGIYLANRGLPDAGLLFWALAGIGMATAGSAILNNFIDRDIDRLMERTCSRALASGSISPRGALAAGLSLVAASFAALTVFVNPAAALLTMAAVFVYVVLYTMILKRTTPFANQVGGIAGALPPVLGYAAVTGSLDAKAAVLFLIMALWQQPHALSLALVYRGDYKKASVPVMPVARGVVETKWRILLYTLTLLPVGFLPYALGMAGSIYLYASMALGVLYVGLAFRFLISSRKSDSFLFLFSIVYLTLVFIAMVIDLS